MKRNVDMNEISDGKLYKATDLARIDCHGCVGCSACCHGMGNTITLDPMDVYRLSKGTGMSFQELTEEGDIELGMVDGLILPNLKMQEKTEGCSFLDENGRCKIHSFRPGICRLFPLGRYYEEDGFKYFLQTHECKCENRSKMKIEKWIGIPNLKEYEQYITDWHALIRKCQGALTSLDDENTRILLVYIIRLFFETPYAAGDDNAFYEEFYGRVDKIHQLF